jgi:hypothetical protein
MSARQWFDWVTPATRAGLALLGLMVPLTSISADSASPAQMEKQAERLEWLLASHDVRYVMQASRARRSDCMRSEME